MLHLKRFSLCRGGRYLTEQNRYPILGVPQSAFHRGVWIENGMVPSTKSWCLMIYIEHIQVRAWTMVDSRRWESSFVPYFSKLNHVCTVLLQFKHFRQIENIIADIDMLLLYTPRYFASCSCSL